MQAALVLAGERHHGREERDGIDGRAQVGQVDAEAQVGGGRGEDVAPVEGRASVGTSTSGLVSSTARDAPPQSATAGASRPLSGPTSTEAPSPTSTAIGRREVPTCGSTTASTTPGQRYGVLRARARPPAAHVVGRDAVGEVDDGDLGGDRADHRVDDADELVDEPVVGEEGDRVVAKGHARRTLPVPRLVPVRGSARWRPSPRRGAPPADRSTRGRAAPPRWCLPAR